MNRVFQISIFVLGVIVVTGCSNLKIFSGTKVNTRKDRTAFSKDEKIGKVVDKDLFDNGGKIVFFPFSAGQGITANDELDKISLMIIKGIADVLDSNPNSSFKLVFAKETDTADILIQGHIISKVRLKKFSLFHFFKKKVSLGFRAKMVDKDSGDLIAVFEGERSLENTDFNVLAFTIGQEIGEFLIKNTTQESGV